MDSNERFGHAIGQGSKFVVAMVENATMFSHLLPGCSCGSKHLLLPSILAIVNLVHAFLCNVCNAISYTTKTNVYTVEPLLYDHPQNHIGVVV